MKTRSLVSPLLLLVLVPILAEAQAFSVSRSGNNVTLIGCSTNNNIYFNESNTPLPRNGQNYTLTVNKTTEGVYKCAVSPDAGDTVIVLRKSQAVLCIIYFIIFFRSI